MSKSSTTSYPDQAYTMTTLPWATAFALILITTAFVSLPQMHKAPLLTDTPSATQLRLLYILPALHRTKPPARQRGTPIHLLIVLGSGGHTAEMLSLLTNLDSNSYTHRSYLTSSGGDFSAGKAQEFERGLVGKDLSATGRRDYSIHTVPRARGIHQSLLTSPLTSLHCLYTCLLLLFKHPQGYPDLILTNGPATSLILILASTILRYFAFLPMLSNPGSGNSRIVAGKMRVIYVESWARVKRLSLSGRVIVWCGLCDRVLVQWKGLETRGWGEYRGALVR